MGGLISVAHNKNLQWSLCNFIRILQLGNEEEIEKWGF